MAHTRHETSYTSRRRAGSRHAQHRETDRRARGSPSSSSSSSSSSSRILAAIAIPVYANQRDKAKDAAVKEGSHLIQNAVMAYAVDHGGAYPATEYVTYTPGDRTADNLGNKYLDTWPRNPWTGQPMKNTGSNVLFNTDFASLNGLTSLQGTWAVVNGQLVPTGSGENRIAFGSTAWTDVELDLSATLNAGRGFGVYYRSDGKANISGYCFQYDPGLGNKFVVRKVNSRLRVGARRLVRHARRVQRLRRAARHRDQGRRRQARHHGRRQAGPLLLRRDVQDGERRSAQLGRRQLGQLRQRQGARQRRRQRRLRRPEQGRLRLRLRRPDPELRPRRAGSPAAPRSSSSRCR